MINKVFCLTQNVFANPAHLTALSARARAESARIDALTQTSEARRGMRHGMLTGALTGTCMAHAIALPLDGLVGTGQARLPATWRYQKDAFAGRAGRLAHPQDPFVVYGAPQGLLGPVVAAAVGFVAGTCKFVGQTLGALIGVITSPVLLLYGGDSTAFKRRVKRHEHIGGKRAFRLGHAATSLCAALASDAVRVPSFAVKCALPSIGLALGAGVGSLAGLKTRWPGTLAERVAGAGDKASAMSQQGIVVLLEMTYLWAWRQARLGVA